MDKITAVKASRAQNGGSMKTHVAERRRNEQIGKKRETGYAVRAAYAGVGGEGEYSSAECARGGPVSVWCSDGCDIAEES